jgi:hypothetical protein
LKRIETSWTYRNYDLKRGIDLALMRRMVK